MSKQRWRLRPVALLCAGAACSACGTALTPPSVTGQEVGPWPDSAGLSRPVARPAKATASEPALASEAEPRPPDDQASLGFDDELVEAHLARMARMPAQQPFGEEEIYVWREAKADAGTIPEKDPRRHPRVAAMPSRRWVGGPQRGARHFLQPIPRTVHQLAGEDLEPGRGATADAWAAWGGRFGYTYRSWSSEDAAGLLPAANLALYESLLARGERVAAGQVLAASVMARHGGLWMGRHATPPTARGEQVDIAAFLPLKGLVAVAAPSSRLLSDVSTWVLWDVLLACPAHPVLVRLEAQLPTVANAAGESPLRPAYATGSVLLSEVMGGAFTLLPAHSARAMGLLPSVDLDR